MNPLTVTLFGGPGTGKSTTSALLFARLKQDGFNAELVPEFAKDLTWERRAHTLDNQPYVVAKQLWRLDRLKDQVEVIVTDTASVLALIYGRNLTDAFKAYIVDDYSRRRTLNILLKRDPNRPYNTRGRSQTEEQAKELDWPIEQMLRKNSIPYHTVSMRQDGSHMDLVYNLAKRGLEWKL